MHLPILTDRTIQAFNWMLIHSLWQGLVISLLSGIVLMATRKSSSIVRYNLLLAVFSLFLLGTCCIFLYELNSLNLPTLSQQRTLQTASKAEIFLKQLVNFCSERSFSIVGLWFIFFIAKSLSIAGNIIYMHRAKRYQISEVGDCWKERIISLCEKLQISRVVLLFESGYVKVPVVVGHLKPIILIPLGLISSLPPEQVEAVLLHELAHIRRNDYVVNLVQSMAETIFFFNPGLLWISKLLQEERENCCDDIAIAQTRNPEEFVQALISFKEYSISAPELAVAFPGQKSTLLNRVMRIVYKENKAFSRKEKGFFIAGLLSLLLIGFTLFQIKESEQIQQHLAKLTQNIQNEFASFASRTQAEPAHTTVRPVKIVYIGNESVQLTPQNLHLIRKINGIKAKWSKIYDVVGPKWNSRYRALDEKWESTWKELEQKWDLIWEDLYAKYDVELKEALAKSYSGVQLQQIKNDHKATVSSLEQIYLTELELLGAKADQEHKEFRAASRRVTDSLHRIQYSEMDSMRNAISKIDRGPKNPELSDSSAEHLSFLKRYEFIMRQSDALDDQTDSMITVRDQIISHWGNYLKCNPEVNPGYYWKVVGYNTRYHLRDPGMENLTYVSANANERYLLGNPQKRRAFDQQLADLRKQCEEKRIEINKLYEMNTTDRTRNMEYFRRQFEQNAYFSSQIKALDAIIDEDPEPNAVFIRRVTRIDLEIYWKKGEKNDKTNQRNNEVVAEVYRQRSALEKLSVKFAEKVPRSQMKN